LMQGVFRGGEARWFREGSLAELPDIDADRDAYDIRRFELAPGDAIFFDFLTVHGAPGFPFSGARRVLSLRYLSAGVTFAPRKWRTSPPFEGLDRELTAGAGLDHPLFPVVWPPRGEPPPRLTAGQAPPGGAPGRRSAGRDGNGQPLVPGGPGPVRARRSPGWRRRPGWRPGRRA